MKKALTVILTMLISFVLFGQNTVTTTKTITDPDAGMSIINGSTSEISHFSGNFTTGGTSRDVSINWQYTDPVAIGSKIKVSEQSGYTFNSWWLNNVRVSLYENSSTPVWENPVTSDWEFPIDMTSDGEYVAVGQGAIIQVFATATQSLVWEKTTTATISGLKLSPDGTMIYVVENMPEGLDKSLVSAYTVGVNDPVWQTAFAGAATAFAASGDCSKLVFCQYTGYNKMWVLNGSDGEVIYDALYKNQNPPALSYDGKFIINGDYSGYAYLHEFDEETGTYFEKWTYKVGGGGTSAWVVGMGISDDGSTVAIGTLVFFTSSYDGEIYTFNTYSNEPLWVFSGCGDEVSAIDLSADGSLIAAASWGPLNHAKPDFYLFRKESSTPIFSINTPGSLNTVDISPNGNLCSLSGKAVHAREFGSGGVLYNVSSNPGGGTISGQVSNLSGAPVENVKVKVEGLDDYYAYTGVGGLYQIKYVPEGTYTVSTSKVGYYPVPANNVAVVEGQVTTLNFQIEETGNPPDLFSVTHGATSTVNLEWTCDEAGTGFNIYRKTIPEALFPETPIATVGSGIFTFSDETALPLKTYYYAVTNIINLGVESPYSNVEEGWVASGFVINEISVYVGSTPTIDGTISPGEWDDAFVMDASDFLGIYDNLPNPVGSVTMYYKVNQDLTELYVACDNQNDVTLEDHDEVALYIDDNNDGTYPATGDDSEGNYWAVYYASGNLLRYRPIYNTGGVGTVIEVSNPQVEVSNATGHIVYEFMVPMGDDQVWKINPNEQNQSGLFTFTLDDPSNFDGYWPTLNQQIFEPAGYGTITFGAEDDVPPPPGDVTIQTLNFSGVVIGNLEWSQPEINDFGHFNVYVNNGAGFEFLDETEGTQMFYISIPPVVAQLYITTVDNAGQESVPSETVTFDPTVGLGEIAFNKEFSVYPNPTTGTANVSFRIDQPGSYQVAVYDTEGRLVRTLLSADLKTGEYCISWNGSSETNNPVKNGIYLMKLSGKQQNSTQKIVLMR